MARLVRKTLIVDADALAELARARGTSESAAVRDAVAVALAHQGMLDALQGLHDIGAFADFEQLFPAIEPEPERPAEQREPDRGQLAKE